MIVCKGCGSADLWAIDEAGDVIELNNPTSMRARKGRVIEYGCANCGRILWAREYIKVDIPSGKGRVVNPLEAR